VTSRILSYEDRGEKERKRRIEKKRKSKQS
jgi:hypothetical protein